MYDSLYKSIILQSPMGYAYHKVLYDENGYPNDYEFLEINPAFERITGLESCKVIGKRITQVFPTIRAGKFDWVAFYGRVATEGLTEEFKQYSEHEDTWYKVYAYSPEPGYFCTLFNHIYSEILELQKHTQYYEKLLNSTYDPLHVVNRELMILYTNEQLNKWLEAIALPNELIGRNLSDAFPFLSNTAFEEYARVIKTGNPITTQEVNHIAGSKYYTETTKSPVFDEEGKVSKVITIIRDINERKRTEENLAITLQSIGDSVIATDVNGRISRMNTQAEFLTGWTYKEAAGKPLDEVFHIVNSGSGEVAFNPVHSVLKTGKKEGMANDTVLVARDGSRRQVADSAAPIMDWDGNITGVVTVFSDVSEQYKIREELKNSEARFRLLAENAHDLIYRLCLYPKRYFEYVSPAATSITGYTPEEHYNDPYLGFKIVHPDDRYILELISNEKISLEEPLTMRWIHKNGTIVWVEQRNTAIYDENNKMIAIEGISRDITKQKQYEAELKYMSLHDRLTGVYNRNFFEEELKRFQGSRDYPISIISVDVDGLKLINDTLGHDTGDKILKACSKVLKEAIRNSDILARIGGDEFTIILPLTDARTGEKIVKRIYTNSAKYNHHYPEIPISLSIGVDTAIDNSKSLQDVFKKADDLMYQSKLHKGTSTKSHIIDALMTTLGERDYITEGHGRRLCEFSQIIGEKKGLTTSQIDNLTLLAHVHDLGKVGIPDNILFKKGPLTEEEWEVMRKHPEKGYRIASSSPDLSGIADLILKHHERFDGSGYPLGIKGQNIPVECRILAIVDSFDAMTNDRPYSKAKSEKEALDEIRRCSGKQFDPEFVEAFISIFTPF